MPRLPEGWAPQGPGGQAGQTEQAGQAGQGLRRPGGRPAAGGAPGRGSGAAEHSDQRTDRYAEPYPARRSGAAQAGGAPRPADGGTPAHGFPRLPDGTQAQGFPRLPDGTPAHGFPRLSDGTPAQGAPRVRGGHPEQQEAGGGWSGTNAGAARGTPRTAPQGPPPGTPSGPGRAAPRGRPGLPIPGQRYAPPGAGTTGPRQAYVDAFDRGDASGRDGEASGRARDVFPSHPAATAARRADPVAPVTDRDDEVGHGAPPREPGTPGKAEKTEKNEGGKGRTFTGIAAAAVTTVLAVVVAGQVADGNKGNTARPEAAGGAGRTTEDYASRTDKRPAPSTKPDVATLSYAQRMAAKYPLAADLEGGGKFDAIPGLDKAPGAGQKYTYRVDVEKDLGLDGGLFAQAVQRTLNDKRSWAHGGGRTFERISSGKPDFVITLASPGTTAFWCAKSGLDTTQDNVSCDSAATDRVMINAYRWAQGSKTYGDEMYAYRQMLINHEVGHRLGYGHVTCSVDGGLAPVMQQQTKFLDHDGIKCRPNPWPFPGK